MPRLQRVMQCFGNYAWCGDASTLLGARAITLSHSALLVPRFNHYMLVLLTLWGNFGVSVRSDIERTRAGMMTKEGPCERI
jgi:hypothetical protein